MIVAHGGSIGAELRIRLLEEGSAPPMRRFVRFRSAGLGCIGLAATLGGSACRSDLTGPTAPALAVKPEWVTGAAAAALDATGSFAYPPAMFAHISPARADSVARAVVAFEIDIEGPVASTGVLASDGGGPVHLSSLRACNRLFYVPNATGPLPAQVDSQTRRFAGSHYVRGMCSAPGEPELSVEVADAPSSITITAGAFVAPWVGNSEWSAFALPAALLDHGLPVSPELAVSLVAQATGVRIMAPPDPMQAYSGGLMARYPALCMIWHVVLERPVQVRGAVATYARSDLYVRRKGACGNGTIAIWAATDSQPSTTMVPLRQSMGGPAIDSLSLPTRYPIRFEEVVIVP